MKKRAELQNQLKQGGSTTLSETERSEVAKNLKLIQREIFDVSEWPDEKLLDIDAALIDWQKISIVNVSIANALLRYFPLMHSYFP